MYPNPCCHSFVVNLQQMQFVGRKSAMLNLQPIYIQVTITFSFIKLDTFFSE